MKLLLFLAIVTLYVVVVGQNWAYYAAAMMIATYELNDGRLRSVPL